MDLLDTSHLKLVDWPAQLPAGAAMLANLVDHTGPATKQLSCSKDQYNHFKLVYVSPLPEMVIQIFNHLNHHRPAIDQNEPTRQEQPYFKP